MTDVQHSSREASSKPAATRRPLTGKEKADRSRKEWERQQSAIATETPQQREVRLTKKRATWHKHKHEYAARRKPPTPQQKADREAKRLYRLATETAEEKEVRLAKQRKQRVVANENRRKRRQAAREAAAR